MIPAVREEVWRRLLIEACAWANLSPDPSTQNAALLVEESYSEDYGEYVVKPLRDTLAVNEFTPGVEYTEERWERPQKYAWVEHAERGAIFKAAALGINCTDLTLVCPWAACADCARAIVLSGISHLVTLNPRPGDTPEHWDVSISRAMEILAKGSVDVTFIDGPLDIGFTIRRAGEAFKP